MYFSRIRLDPGVRQHPETVAALADDYGIHKLLWSFFPDKAGRPRDFLYRVHDGSPPCIYIVSARTPTSPNTGWLVETKPYAPALAVGDSLRFLLRVNPVVSRRDEADRQHRHDVVMDAKKRRASAAESIDDTSLAELVQHAGEAWLQVRAEKNGFVVQGGSLRSDGYTVRSFRKRGLTAPVQLGTVDLAGLLSVTDRELFLRALFEGIGPAKGFGCGLMMIKPS